MKKLVLVLLAVAMFTSTAFAGNNLVNMVWNTNLYVGEGTSIHGFDLDVSDTGYFYALTGAFTANSGAMPCDGSGYEGTAGNINLSISCGTRSFNITINPRTLNGTVEAWDIYGFVTEGNVVLSGTYPVD